MIENIWKIYHLAKYISAFIVLNQEIVKLGLGQCFTYCPPLLIFLKYVLHACSGKTVQNLEFQFES